MLIKGTLTLNTTTRQAVIMRPALGGCGTMPEQIEADIRNYDNYCDGLPLIICQGDFDTMCRMADDALVELVHRRLLTILPSIGNMMTFSFKEQ